MLNNKNKANNMDTLEQETQQASEDWEEVGEESMQQEQETGQKTENEESKTTKEIVHQKRKKNERKRGSSITQGSSFVHGLATGLGIGCITAFVMMWMAVFFTPRLPIGITYEAMLATFIYPLIYLFALGLIALTVGIVAEYYTVKNRI
jgi:cation transport ATPase